MASEAYHAVSSVMGRHRWSVALLLFACLLAPSAAWADASDLGGMLLELNNNLDEPQHAPISSELHPPPPINFDCETGRTGLACTDNHKLQYSCADYGASGQYCKRQDGKVWIHCFPRFFRRYQCAVISNTSAPQH